MALHQREEHLRQAGRQVQQLSSVRQLQAQQLGETQSALQRVVGCVNAASLADRYD